MQMKNSYTFTFTDEVPYYQCDVGGRAKLSYLLRLIERAAGSHLELLGLPYERLYAEGKVFLLAKLGLEVLRCPTAADKLVVETAPQETKGAQFGRQVLILTDAGELLARAHTIWLLIEPAARKILRPNQFGHALPCIPAEEAIAPLANVRIRPEGEPVAESSHLVKYSHLDVNRHLNNTVYGDIVTDCLPFAEMAGGEVAEFAINYQHEALYGEEIALELRRAADGCYYVTGRKADSDCFVARVRLRAL